MKFPKQAWFRPRKKFFLLAAVFSFLAAPPFLQGGGKKQDSPLEQADTLIKDKQYDEAIHVLTDYLRENPDDFDRAQERFQRIVGIRSRYNLVTGELLDTVVTDTDNSERILALTRQLESLESARNPQTRAFIARTRDIAQFAYNRKRLEEILREGKALTLQGDYRGALLTYRGGMNIYQEEFFSSGYGELVEDRVRQDIEGINGGVESFLALSNVLGTQRGQLQGALGEEPGEAANSGLSRVREIYGRMESGMDNLTDIQGNLSRTAAYFDELLLRLQEADSSLGDRSFLSFASRLINGHGGNASEDGMLVTVAAYWNSLLPGLEKGAGDTAESWYRAGMAYAENGDYAAALEDFQVAGDYAGLSLAFLEKDRVFKAQTGGPGARIFDRIVPEDKAGDFLRSESLVRALDLLQSTQLLGLEYREREAGEESLIRSWEEQKLGSLEIFSREKDLGELYRDFRNRIEDLIAGADRESAALGAYASSPDRALSVPNHIGETRAVQAALRDLIAGRGARSAVRRYTAANGDMARRLAERREEFAGAESYIRGVPRDQAAAGETGPAPGSAGPYPAEGLEILNRMGEAIERDLETGGIFLTRYGEEDRSISGLPEILSLRAATGTAVNDLGSLQSAAQILAADARTRIARAESLRLEGERYFREAQNAAAANNLEEAKERLERAAERYTASLAIQESASLRADWDTRAVALGADIHRRENEVVVREMRNMVNAARSAYFAGNFDLAEEFLVRAQNRWQAINVLEDPEIIYWLSIVRGALALRSDRVISATAPLYPEMSQLLSAAMKNYGEGVNLIEAGRRPQGLTRLADSRYMIQRVKLMFPVNQEAGLLELRIDQVTDPAAFNASFQRRLNDAIAGTRQKSLESFADLQNLAELNPRYPGIQNALVQAEIDMGRRPAPPNPVTLARSNELTTAARRIVENNARLQFEVALRQLNEALTLNPNNTQAMSLKDRVQTEMGGSGNIVLSSAAEGEYQRAVRELQQGNTLVALAIVEQLLQDSRNRNSTRILELERRIHSIL
jgi:tetratricopeptide (TPR) repeat protein